MKTTLGIDLGTTKAAAVIVAEDGALLAVSGAPHHADLPAEPGGADQDVRRILDCARAEINRLPAELRRTVGAVGITGQMHSVLLGGGGKLSPLTTWQDRRCGEAMLAGFRRRAGITLRNGFGGTTLARLAAGNALGGWSFAAAIGDFLAATLAGNDAIVTDPTHAASWGLYDMETGNWNFAAADALGIPAGLLPRIRPCGSVIGKLCSVESAALGIPPGIPVVNAIGDNQASILATGKAFGKELYLTLGTGAQLSMVLDRRPAELPDALELRPFPGNRLLLTAAPLCGGAAFAWLADTVNAFRRDLGETELPRRELLDKLDELGLAVLEAGEDDVTAGTHFLGERHDPSLRGSFDGFTLSNATPGRIAAALAVGIVRNLKQRFPPELLAERTTVIGSGNAVRLVKSIQFAIRREFGLALELSSAREEAAVGAAELAAQCL